MQEQTHAPERKTIVGLLNGVNITNVGDDSMLIILFIGDTKLTLQGGLALYNDYRQLLKTGNLVVANYEACIAGETHYVDADSVVTVHERTSNRVQDLFEGSEQHMQAMLRDDYKSYGIEGIELLTLVRKDAAPRYAEIVALRKNTQSAISVAEPDAVDIDAQIAAIKEQLTTASPFKKTVLTQKLAKLEQSRAASVEQPKQQAAQQAEATTAEVATEESNG